MPRVVHEIVVRSPLLHAELHLRLLSANRPGRPDLVLPKYAAAAFANGYFWHLHHF